VDDPELGEREKAKRVYMLGLGRPAPTLDELVAHGVKYGPDCLMETAEMYLDPEQLVTLAARVNAVIDPASKRKQDDEPREVTSYRARITEARSHGTQKHWLERVAVKQPKGDDVDPRVKMTLDLHAKGAKSSVIASKVGRSTSWVTRTIKASEAQSDAVAA
jgi:hypothetical protein